MAVIEGGQAITTRTDEDKKKFDPNAPGPEFTVHYAISQAALTRGVCVKNANEFCERQKADAETWLEHHKSMASTVGDSPEVQAFLAKGYQAQCNGAEDQRDSDIATANKAFESDVSGSLFYFTSIEKIPESEQPNAWAFDAPLGFGDLSIEEEQKIALAGKK